MLQRRRHFRRHITPFLIDFAMILFRSLVQIAFQFWLLSHIIFSSSLLFLFFRRYWAATYYVYFLHFSSLSFSATSLLIAFFLRFSLRHWIRFTLFVLRYFHILLPLLHWHLRHISCQLRYFIDFHFQFDAHAHWLIFHHNFFDCLFCHATPAATLLYWFSFSFHNSLITSSHFSIKSFHMSLSVIIAFLLFSSSSIVFLLSLGHIHSFHCNSFFIARPHYFHNRLSLHVSE